MVAEATATVTAAEETEAETEAEMEGKTGERLRKKADVVRETPSPKLCLGTS